MRVRNKAVILLLLPAAVLFWLVGWSLVYMGSKSTLQRKEPPPEKTAPIFSVIVAENPKVLEE
ncbi:MAG: hypothetical protein ABSB28_01615 [Candidatus Bathyarchaeia archaeon]